jgi:enterochelin esterase-like enzyme
VRRRTFLELLASSVAAAHAGQAEPRSKAQSGPAASPFVRHDLLLQGDRRTAKNAVLFVPRQHARGSELPLLILLHGLGETKSVALGLRAWPELYGLLDSYSRLASPPVEGAGICRRCIDGERLALVNASLKARPFRGFAVVCPVTPNPHQVGPAAQTLDAYAAWIQERLLPAVGDRIRIADRGRKVAIDGCSLGGYVALETFVRRPALFAGAGMVQGAIGEAHVDRTARRVADALERVGARPLHLLTSSNDVYRRANERLSASLTRLGVSNRLELTVGAHDQLWLREIGTLTMLLWHDRGLG